MSYETRLMDAIQRVAEVARDSIVANAQRDEKHGEPCVRVFSCDFEELRDALKGWRDAGEAMIRDLRGDAAPNAEKV